MSGLTMLMHLFRERLSLRELARVPEPQLIMDGPVQAGAFTEIGREDGILAAIYFFHALQISPLVRSGDTVLDLGCGPANQLAQVARLNPQARFIGLDASPAMLELAHATVQRSKLDNVELIEGDMTRLASIGTGEVDCVTCTMSLHHLPNVAALHLAMREARRVLKTDGGAYFADFGRLRRIATLRFFAHDRADCQSAQFTEDYFNSLRAAFSVKEMAIASALLGPGMIRHRTALAPFMVVIKSHSRRRLDAPTRQLAQQTFSGLTTELQRDFRLFARWFRLAGLALPYAPE